MTRRLEQCLEHAVRLHTTMAGHPEYAQRFLRDTSREAELLDRMLVRLSARIDVECQRLTVERLRADLLRKLAKRRSDILTKVA